MKLKLFKKLIRSRLAKYKLGEMLLLWLWKDLYASEFRRHGGRDYCYLLSFYELAGGSAPRILN